MMDQQNVKVEAPNIDKNKLSEELEESMVKPDENDVELNEEQMDSTIDEESGEVIIERDEDDEELNEEQMDNTIDKEYDEVMADDDEDDEELNEEHMEYSDREIMLLLDKRSTILRLDYIEIQEQQEQQLDNRMSTGEQEQHQVGHLIGDIDTEKLCELVRRNNDLRHELKVVRKRQQQLEQLEQELQQHKDEEDLDYNDKLLELEIEHELLRMELAYLQQLEGMSIEERKHFEQREKRRLFLNEKIMEAVNQQQRLRLHDLREDAKRLGNGDDEEEDDDDEPIPAMDEQVQKSSSLRPVPFEQSPKTTRRRINSSMGENSVSRIQSIENQIIETIARSAEIHPEEEV